jgi:hypothetical protein
VSAQPDGGERRSATASAGPARRVWIPVTVAALVPGVVFLAVPFIDALRLFAKS